MPIKPWAETTLPDLAQVSPPVLAGRLLLAALTALLAWGALWTAEQPYRERAFIQARHDVQSAALGPRARIESEMASILHLARGLAAVFALDGLPDAGRYRSLAAQVLEGAPHVRNITLSEGTVMRLVHPLAGNEATVGVDYRSLPAQWPLIERAIISGQPVLAGPVPLVQGGTGVIQRLAITAPAQDNGAPPRFLGLINVVVDMDSVVAAAGMASAEGRALDVALRGEDAAARSPAVYWGDPAVFERDPVRLSLTLPGGTWELAVVPSSGWDVAAPLDPFLFALKIGASLLVGGGMFGLLSHLGTRRRAMEQLRTSEARLRDAQRIGGLGAFEWNALTGLGWWSREFRALVGWAPEAPGGVGDVLALLAPPDRRRLREAVTAALHGGGRTDLELPLRPASGRPARVLRVWADALPNGRLRGLVHDVTDLARADAERDRLVARLQRSNEELEQFATIAAHDLQEPLRQIASHLQLLQRRYGTVLDSDAHTFIAFAVEGARRMQRQILDLEAYARLNTGPGSRGRVCCEIELQGALDTLKPKLLGSGARVHAGPLPMVHGEADQIALLFRHLLSNAVAATDPDRPNDIHVDATRHGDAWQITVRDSGVGIAAEYQDKVFHIFRRLGPSDGEASGIGLALCRRIVESHGGAIILESEPGQGTTVRFTLPSCPEAGAPPARDQVAVAGEG